MPSQPDAGTVPLVPGPGGINVPANARTEDGRYIYVPQQGYPPPQPLQHGSPYGAPPSGLPGGTDRHVNGMNMDGADDREREREPHVSREAGVVGEAAGAGPPIREDANGERRVVYSPPADSANAEHEQQGASRGSFTSVNQ